MGGQRPTRQAQATEPPTGAALPDWRSIRIGATNAMVTARLFVGTSGYQYRHWREVFYPRGLATSGWFDFYAEHFRSVEINNKRVRKITPQRHARPNTTYA